MKKPRSAQLTHLEDPEFGPIVFARSPRAKRISIAVRPFKPVRVAYPWRGSLKQARQWFDAHRPWVAEHLEKIRRTEERQRRAAEQAEPINPIEARNFLANRLAELARQHGFTYRQVFLRRQKTLWGSCSGPNNINLNMALMRLPAELIDYVLLHELVHTRIKNHSPAFWAELTRILPDARTRAATLKQYRDYNV